MTNLINDERTVAQIFKDAIEANPSVTQKELAEVAGLNKPNVIYMFKQGLTKIPLDKAGKVVRKLDLDESDFWFKCFKEYMPTAYSEFERVTKQPALTTKEVNLINLLREKGVSVEDVLAQYK